MCDALSNAVCLFTQSAVRDFVCRELSAKPLRRHGERRQQSDDLVVQLTSKGVCDLSCSPLYGFPTPQSKAGLDVVEGGVDSFRVLFSQGTRVARVTAPQ